MITGAIKNKVDKIWTDIWAGGITNPLTVIEQLTYLMFIRSLDEKEQETESLENMTGEKMSKIFPQSTVGQSMRWSKFKNSDPREIYEIISKRVFPSLKEMWNGQLPDFDEKTGELIPIPGSPADRAAKARKAAVANAEFVEGKKSVEEDEKAAKEAALEAKLKDMDPEKAAKVRAAMAAKAAKEAAAAEGNDAKEGE